MSKLHPHHPRGSVGVIVHLGQFEKNADNAGDHGLLLCNV